MEKKTLEISRYVDANPDLVWTCYTDPGHMLQWNFASEDWHCPKAENDLRPGGRLLARMEARDGSMGFDFEGIYQEVRLFELLRYRIADGRVVEVRFTAQGSGTLVQIAFEAEQQHPEHFQQQGWQAILDSFSRHAELTAATEQES